MIFIAVKFTALDPEEWLTRLDGFTAATRREPGNLFFDWSHSVENPNQFVLLEAFADAAAGEAHVNSDHFEAAIATMSELVAEVPEIINVEVEGTGWSRMAEVTPRHR
ncbi:MULTISPECIES: antibiotic biosynthesis monooxygenase [unclassified Streptomyces]|uniref:putative quinol monooxygenase n=1 Tax=unclassified Streptomyces TaxID=2593676 RepID=UPI001BE784AE|nr:antibiotic biosynthesis monooxygenase [Streptomyces sp. McG3]MBT2900444.1 antibiotic biosynthesis monooxygenase [Streptomyces sp. McG3]